MKVYPQPELYFAEKEMSTDLGEGNFIFVGSSTDMWAKIVPIPWITNTLIHCSLYANRYLFQSKDPERFGDFVLPHNSLLGTTIETNREYGMTKAPPVWERYDTMTRIYQPRMVSIEPIMDFDLGIMVEWIGRIEPEFVSIGADSKGHKLLEPSPSKIRMLIEELEALTIVKIKDNLKRLLV